MVLASWSLSTTNGLPAMLTNFPSKEHVAEPASEHPAFVDDAFLSTVIFDISNSLPCELLGFCNDRRSVVIDLQRGRSQTKQNPNDVPVCHILRMASFVNGV